MVCRESRLRYTISEYYGTQGKLWFAGNRG